MKIYRFVVIILAVLLGMAFGLWLLFMPNPQAALKDPVTEEYYEMLQKNAMDVARTLDVKVLTDKTLTADFYYKDNELVVTVKSYKAKVVANIPVSNYELSIKDEEFTSHGIIEFEKVEFEKTNELEPAWWYMLMSIFGGGVVAFAVWGVFYKAWAVNNNSK